MSGKNQFENPKEKPTGMFTMCRWCRSFQSMISYCEGHKLIRSAYCVLLMFLYSQVYQYFITAHVELVFITCYYLWLCLNSVDCTDTASKGNTQLIAKHSCLLPLSKLAQWANWQVDEWVQGFKEMFDILQASFLSQPASNNNSNTLIQMKPKWRSGNVSAKCIQAQSEANRHSSKLRCWRFLTPIHTSCQISNCRAGLCSLILHVLASTKSSTRLRCKCDGGWVTHQALFWYGALSSCQVLFAVFSKSSALLRQTFLSQQ